MDSNIDDAGVAKLFVAGQQGNRGGVAAGGPRVRRAAGSRRSSPIRDKQNRLLALSARGSDGKGKRKGSAPAHRILHLVENREARIQRRVWGGDSVRQARVCAKNESVRAHRCVAAKRTDFARQRNDPEVYVILKSRIRSGKEI